MRGKSIVTKKSAPAITTLRGLSSKIQFKNLGELHVECSEAAHQEPPCTWVLFMGWKHCVPCVNPGLNHRRCQKHLTVAKEKKNRVVAHWLNILFFKMKVKLEFGGKANRHKIHIALSPVGSFHGDDLLCHSICWRWFAAVSEVQWTQIFSSSCFLLLTNFCKDADRNYILEKSHVAL